MALRSFHSYNENGSQGSRRAQTAKFTSAFVFAIAVVWFCIGVLIKEALVSSTAAMLMLTSVFIYILAQHGRDWWARVLWIVSATVAVLLGHFTVHPVGNVEVMMLAMVGAPFLLFSLRRERTTVAIIISLNIAVLLFMLFTPHDLFGAPVIEYDTAFVYFRWPSLLTSVAVVVLQMSIFATMGERHNRRLLESNFDAQQSNRAKSAFLASMSHEIRTPMNGVIGLIEMLEHSDLNDDQRRMLRTVRESSFSLLRIIDDILDTSKIEAGRLELKPAPMDLLALVEGVVETMNSFAADRNVQLRLKFESDLPAWITADPGRLRQIFLNLLSNAVKFSSKHPKRSGVVEIIVTHDQHKRLKFVVKDNGIGMNEEMLSRLFQPFSQADDVSGGNFGGTGLGLTIVKQLLEKMGGFIVVDSAPDQGATFTVTLPIVAGSGVLEFPDLQEYTVYLRDTGDRGHRVLHRYIEKMKANLVLCSSLQTLITEARNRRDKTIVIVEDVIGPDAKTSTLHSPTLLAAKIKVPTLVISNDRNQSAGGNGHVYSLKSSPLLPSHLFSAISYLTDVPLHTASRPASERPLTVSRRFGRQLRVLVAEDHVTNQFVIQKQLEKLECDATIVADGEEALTEWRKGVYDVVLTDCHMPNMNGFELTQAIRDSEKGSDKARTPIIAITANALSGEADRCLEAGMDDYLSKPVKIEKLAQVLNNWAMQMAE